MNDGLVAVLQVDTYGFGNPVKKRDFGTLVFGRPNAEKRCGPLNENLLLPFLSQSACKIKCASLPLGECQREIYVIRQLATRKFLPIGAQID